MKFFTFVVAACLFPGLGACGAATPSPEQVEPKGSVDAKPTTDANAESDETASKSESAAKEPKKPAVKTYSLAEYDVPFSIDLGADATFKKLSEAMNKVGFVGVRVYDDAANIGFVISTVPAKMQTMAGIKADYKKGYGATFVKEDADLVVYDMTNKGATKVFGFSILMKVDNKFYNCYSAVIDADAPEKLDASIAACKALKSVK